MHWHLPARQNSGRRAVQSRLLAALCAFGPILLTLPATAAEPVFDCVIDPSQTVKLGSSVPGLLAEVLVSRGDVVAPGQVIAKLESRVETAALAYNRARAASSARIDAQLARLALTRARMDRASQLLEKHVVAQDKFDELQADLRVAEQDLAREKLERDLALIEVDRSEATFDQRVIRSPIGGVVSERKLTAGEFIYQEGYIAVLAQLDPLHVEAFLPVRMYPQLRTGMSGIVRPDPPIGGSYEAKIVVVDRVFDASSGTFGVRLALPNSDHRLPAGQRCKVYFPETTGEMRTLSDAGPPR
ncbi:efflux RND transporter periplasmic adaptor subunit [Bradyrhizobium sp. CNPSo 4010]|uniref:Efflux RND transporter periplasmic adaptor subunit n=1 Tax=Bradyrhizobium agreste TaxID=2751811 RepID=A0ABS0PZF8_9BRAD|nr:efflux RND transporter periplasmic adaptor subunit [Bradyrhizobium agreste]MBH5402613.1 efflux RND transporter periplasmic adaptor subunit [Bradyrhizobium agreste]